MERYLLAAATMLWLGAGLSACNRESNASSAPSVQGAESKSILQFAALADPGETAGVAEYSFEGAAVRLRTPRTFDLEDARPDLDASGYPALNFEIVESQKDEFRRWTAGLIDRQLAVIIDGEVVTMPKVNSELPGKGIIEFGARQKTVKEIRALAARLLGRAE